MRKSSILLPFVTKTWGRRWPPSLKDGRQSENMGVNAPRLLSSLLQDHPSRKTGRHRELRLTVRKSVLNPIL